MPVLVHCHEFAPMRESCGTRIPAKGSHEFANLTERAVGHDVSTDNHVRSRENQSVQNGHFLKRQIIIGAAMIEGSDPNWPRSSPSGNGWGLFCRLGQNDRRTERNGRGGQGDASNIHPHLRGIKNDVPTLTSPGIDKNLAKTALIEMVVFGTAKRNCGGSCALSPASNFGECHENAVGGKSCRGYFSGDQRRDNSGGPSCA